MTVTEKVAYLKGLGVKIELHIALVKLNHKSFGVEEVAAVVYLGHHFDYTDLAAQCGKICGKLKTHKTGTENKNFLADFVHMGVGVFGNKDALIIDSGDGGDKGMSAEGGNDNISAHFVRIFGADSGIHAQINAAVCNAAALVLDVSVKIALEGNILFTENLAAQLVGFFAEDNLVAAVCAGDGSLHAAYAAAYNENTLFHLSLGELVLVFYLIAALGVHSAELFTQKDFICEALEAAHAGAD